MKWWKKKLSQTHSFYMHIEMKNNILNAEREIFKIYEKKRKFSFAVSSIVELAGTCCRKKNYLLRHTQMKKKFIRNLPDLYGSSTYCANQISKSTPWKIYIFCIKLPNKQYILPKLWHHHHIRICRMCYSRTTGCSCWCVWYLMISHFIKFNWKYLPSLPQN